MQQADASNETGNDSDGIAYSALYSAESFIARSPDAGSSCDGSGAAFSATFKSLLEWGEQNKVIREESEYEFFKRPPDGYGDEHQCWFDPETDYWSKATHSNRFGLAWGRDKSATPHEYLLRLILQNVYFGDAVELIALVNCDGKLRVLTSQQHVAGDPATYEEIQDWFELLRFNRVAADDRIAWYYEPENLLVADAHEGNVIRTPHNSLIPIDLNIIQPKGPLLEQIRSLL